MEPGRRRLVWGVSAAVAALVLGRWTANFATARLWEARVSEAAALVGTRFALLGAGLELLGLLTAVAWFVGGVAILLFTRFKVRDHEAQGLELTQLTPRMAILIGLAQAFALWPGISRSLVTIIGGVFLGLRLSAAVEFSFLLGLITLSAATGWEALHEGQEMLGAYGWTGLVAGFVSAFIAAIVSVKWMVAYLNWRELYLFGYYRILLAAFTAVLLALDLL